ncbi:unnamed protein product [Protopolystoma xenopodis]|uniref:Uncharacterized protein n=1 Tax=Protopolystoma xenopodis TaxID=117903 RepID=A0A3S5AHG5_9PLAT|nr:unnamed protein product [Protopolystoma xenopodis]
MTMGSGFNPWTTFRRRLFGLPASMTVQPDTIGWRVSPLPPNYHTTATSLPRKGLNDSSFCKPAC